MSVGGETHTWRGTPELADIHMEQVKRFTVNIFAKTQAFDLDFQWSINFP